MKIDVNKLKNIPFVIAEHAFWACLGLFILSLAVSLLLFFRYDYMAKKQVIESLGQECVFNREVYNNVLSTWKEQEESFNNINNKEYINPFLKPVDLEED